MLMCVDDAAEVIGIGRDELRKRLRDKSLPLPHVPIGSVKLVNMAHVQEWLDAQTVGLEELMRDG